MKLHSFANNRTVLIFNGGTTEVFFSYETPVAGWDQDGPFKTEQFYSKTTSKHINKYFFGGQIAPRLVSQDYINQLTER